MNPILTDFPDQFTTKRLFVRVPIPGDGAILYDGLLESRETLRPWLEFANSVPTLEGQEEYSRRARARFLLREDFAFNIFEKASGKFVGCIGLQHIDWKVRKFEVAAWIRTSFRRHGFMTEALNELTELAGELFKANRIEIRCNPMNLPSRNVAKRCGYHLEVTLRRNAVDPQGQIHDECIYAKVRLEDGTLGYSSES